MRQFGAASDHPQPTHSLTQLWVPPSSVTPQDQRLVVAQTHIKMVAHYSDKPVAAMEQHHETTDQWSFECDPLTGAMTCAATMPPIGDTDAEWHTNRLPSSLNDEDTLPDPPLEAHVEPKDRCSSTALTDVPDALSAAPTNHTDASRRPDWVLWKAACIVKMNDLVKSGTIVLGRPPTGAKIVHHVQVPPEKQRQG